LLRADFQLIETYHYEKESPLGCPITVFGGVNDHRATREALLAWRQETTNEFRLRMLPGDHFFLRTSESLLLRLMSQMLSIHQPELSRT
jgi:surfactin synthase thioesterase subunit